MAHWVLKSRHSQKKKKLRSTLKHFLVSGGVLKFLVVTSKKDTHASLLELLFFFFFLSLFFVYILTMATLEDKSLWETQDDNDDIDKDVLRANPEEINNRTRLLENDIKVRMNEKKSVNYDRLTRSSIFVLFRS